jgi:hypothetical protein
VQKLANMDKTQTKPHKKENHTHQKGTLKKVIAP